MPVRHTYCFETISVYLILYTIICRKCTIRFFVGMSKCIIQNDFLWVLSSCHLFHETFSRSTNRLRWAGKKYITKGDRSLLWLFPELFKNLHCVLSSFMTLIPTYKPKFICPGGGNVALKSRNWPVFLHRIIEALPFPPQILHCLLLKRFILRNKILYLLLLESTAFKIPGY